jgi:C-terminal processing protease CtpA/Prc
MATAYGNSTTTTYGSQTSHVPMTFNRYEFGAAYFVKKKFTFGANYRDLTNEERAALQSNSSIYVDSVVNDTPAFRNDLLVGDIIAKLDGQVIYGPQAATGMLSHRRGQEVELTIVRKGQLIEKKMRLAK